MESTTPPASIAAYLACTAFTLALIYYVLEIFGKLRSKPQPAEVLSEVARTYATKTEFGELRQANENIHSHLFAKIGGVERGVEDRLGNKITELSKRVDQLDKQSRADRDEIIDKAEKSVVRIHERVDDLVKAVSLQTGILGEVKNQVTGLRSDFSNHLNAHQE